MAIENDLQNAHERRLHILFAIEKHSISLGRRDVLEDVPRLAFKHFAQHIERAEANSSDLTRLDAREVHVGNTHFVGKLVQGYMAICHDFVEMKNDRHRPHLQGFV